jgi:hypothetical protein
MSPEIGLALQVMGFWSWEGVRLFEPTPKECGLQSRERRKIRALHGNRRACGTGLTFPQVGFCDFAAHNAKRAADFSAALRPRHNLLFV